MSGDMKSTPQMFSPIAFAARTAARALSGWITSITSTAVAPAETLAMPLTRTTRPASTTLSARDALPGEDPVTPFIQRDEIHEPAAYAPRITVLDLDQFGDGVTSVPCDRRRVLARRRDKFPGYDKQPVVGAGEKTLHHVRPLVNPRRGGGSRQLRFVSQIDKHGLALPAVNRLQHHRISDLLADFLAAAISLTMA